MSASGQSTYGRYDYVLLNIPLLFVRLCHGLSDVVVWLRERLLQLVVDHIDLVLSWTVTDLSKYASVTAAWLNTFWNVGRTSSSLKTAGRDSVRLSDYSSL